MKQNTFIFNMSVLRAGDKCKDTKMFAINDTLMRGIAVAKLA